MEDDEEEDDEDEEEEEAPKGKAAAAKKGAAVAVNGKKAASAAVASPSLTAAATPASAASLGSSSLSTLPTPSLSSLSADIGMDQLRQRLHERIHGLSNKRKPEDHPFAKKRHKPDPKDKKKREKNEERPSSHKGTAKPLRPREDAAEQPAAKKQKSASTTSSTTAAAPSSSTTASASSRLTVRESDIADSNDFQFAELKPLANPQAKTGSFSLQGKQQRKKHKADDTLLREVESFENKVADLKASGATELARQIETERAMSNALLRAQGVKVKDDKKLLKKSLKREEKKKDKSRQEWSEAGA